MTPNEAIELMRQSQTDALDAIVDGIEQRHKRRLHGSREDQAAHETNSALWAKLYAAPYIEHRGGRSFQRPGCATCLTQGEVMALAAEREATGFKTKVCPVCRGWCSWGTVDVGAVPADHLDGTCFECSGVDAPEGFSQAERRARAEGVAEMPRLRMVLQ